ncbi:MAG: ribosome maturation factor RimP [Dermatophilaceae bacterium]
MSTQEQVTALVGPVAAAHGLVLDGLDITAAGKRRLVRVTLDRAPVAGPDGWTSSPTEPLSLDDVADVSRAISAALDGATGLGSAPYVLEVSSPGVGRPLREPRHFQRNVGRILVAQTEEGPVTGRVVRAGPDSVVLSVRDVAGGRSESTLPYAALTRAHVEVEFGSATADSDDAAGHDDDDGDVDAHDDSDEAADPADDDANVDADDDDADAADERN